MEAKLVRMNRKKKILLVTLHFDDSHLPIRRRNKLPQGMGAVFLAGAFSPDRCEIKVYSELYSGPLENRRLLSWPDMVVMTGVTNCFDRMLHITAYARSLNNRVIIVAGGPAVRALPTHSSLFFDHCCLGDMEQLQDVAKEAFGSEYAAEKMIPRLDLAHWIGMHGHAESSRNCNFSCNFCSTTSEGGRYQRYELNVIADQLHLMGKRRTVQFIDNNFYGNNRDHFLAKLDLLDHFRKKGQFRYWSALVTSDFFLNDENLVLARKSGCCALFSGVESFDRETLRNYNKIQNTKAPQTEIITKTLEHGISFWYGLILDVYSRPLERLHDELDYIISNHRLTLPGFLSIPIPLIGTPYFLECLEQKRFLPHMKLRDMDGTTLCMTPLSPMEETTAFIANMDSLVGYRVKIAKHALRFARHYQTTLNPEKMLYALAGNALTTLNPLFTANALTLSRRRTHVTTTEQPDSTYKPAFQVERRFEHYFKPTMVTDFQGSITRELQHDIACSRVTGEPGTDKSSHDLPFNTLKN